MIGGAGADTFTSQGSGAHKAKGGGGIDTFNHTSTSTLAVEDLGTGGNDVFTVANTAGVLTATATANYTAASTVNNAAAVTQAVITAGGFDINMSAVLTGTNGFTINGSDSTAATLTGSGKADVIVGGNSAESIVGGAGADSFTGDAGSDTITGGTGIDTFNYLLAAENAAANGTMADVITDFTTAVDKIVFPQGAILTGVTTDGSGDAFDRIGTNVVDATSVADVEDVTNAVAANAAFSTALTFVASNALGTDTNFSTISFANGAAAGTYVVLNDATAAFQEANDMIIGLGVGVVTIAEADFSVV
jgi:Ca2+-binding RTX toxin-like protein